MSKAVEEVRARQALAKSRKNNAIAKRKRLGVRVDSVSMTREARQVPPIKGLSSEFFQFPAQFKLTLICDAPRGLRRPNGAMLHQIAKLWRAAKMDGWAHPIPQVYEIHCTAKDEMDAYNKMTKVIELWVEHGDARD